MSASVVLYPPTSRSMRNSSSCHEQVGETLFTGPGFRLRAEGAESLRVPRVSLLRSIAVDSLAVGLFVAVLRVLGESPTPMRGFAEGGSLIFLVVGTRSLVLEHPTRARIYEHLRLLPGDHFRSIARTLGLGVGEVRHHLSILLRNDLLRENKSNRRCRYYPSGDEIDSDRNTLFEKHWDYRDLRLRVLFAVRSLPDARPSTVAKTLGISRQLASYHLSSLMELGLVKKKDRRYHV